MVTYLYASMQTWNSKSSKDFKRLSNSIKSWWIENDDWTTFAWANSNFYWRDEFIFRYINIWFLLQFSNCIISSNKRGQTVMFNDNTSTQKTQIDSKQICSIVIRKHCISLIKFPFQPRSIHRWLLRIHWPRQYSMC